MRLQSIVTPLTEFDHPEKGDALYGELLSASICLHHVLVIPAPGSASENEVSTKVHC